MIAAALGGCATREPARVSQACPAIEKPVCPPSTPSLPAPAPEARGKLVPGAWSQLPEWGRDLGASLQAFVRGCAALEKLAAWETACLDARSLPADASDSDIARFFEQAFDVYRVVNADDGDSGLVTGYYEPLLHGSRAATARFRYPIYGVPQDLLVIDLGAVYPDLRFRRLRGRVQGNRVVPYLDRGQIDSEPAPLKGLEIAWVDDAVDLFFLHIQGSGQVELESGERIRVGYAEQNGHPFRSTARVLIDLGEIAPERASMQAIKDWARHNPQRVQQILNTNPSYVFFRELPASLPGPLGSLGVPLTPERSIAVDPRVVPLGAPVYLATTWPNTDEPLARLMAAQDTGGAIAGGVRADFFWGFGEAAGAQAGRMRQSGRMWVLLPKGVAPSGLTSPTR